MSVVLTSPTFSAVRRKQDVQSPVAMCFVFTPCCKGAWLLPCTAGPSRQACTCSLVKGMHLQSVIFRENGTVVGTHEQKERNGEKKMNYDFTAHFYCTFKIIQLSINIHSGSGKPKFYCNNRSFSFLIGKQIMSYLSFSLHL